MGVFFFVSTAYFSDITELHNYHFTIETFMYARPCMYMYINSESLRCKLSRKLRDFKRNAHANIVVCTYSHKQLQRVRASVLLVYI